MLDNLVIAKILTDRLNAVAEMVSKEHSFKIYADTAMKDKSLDWLVIEGMLYTEGGYIKPVAEFSNTIASYRIEFLVPTPQFSNKHIEITNSIFQKFIRDLNGKSEPLGDGKGIFTFKSPTFFSYEDRPATGGSMIAALQFDINYSENAVSSTDVILKLDGVELKSARVRVLLEPSGAVNNISGISNTKTLLMKQTKFYEVSAPYITDPLCVQLQKDILNCDISKTYELTYIDGIAFTEESPYVSTVALFRTNDSTADKPKVAELSLVFTDADKVQTSGVQYYMALIDNPFDDNNINTRWFSDQKEQRTWFEDKILWGARYEQIKAPNINSLTITQQVYNVGNDIPASVEGYDLHSLLSKNYAVVKVDRAEKKNYMINSIIRKFNTEIGFVSVPTFYTKISINNYTGVIILSGDTIDSLSEMEVGQTYYSWGNQAQSFAEMYVYRGRGSMSPDRQIKADWMRFDSVQTGTADLSYTPQYYYYQIQSASVGANNQILLDLKLDTIQTYYFDPNIKIADCMIQRAHLDRFIDNGDGTISFNGDISSALFEQEDIKNIAKKLKSRQKIQLNSSSDPIVNEWLSTRDIIWVYAFFDGTNSLSGQVTASGAYSFKETKRLKYNFGSTNGYTTPMVCYVAPIVMGGRIFIKNNRSEPTSYTEWETASLFEGIVPRNTTKVLDIKFSLLPPFKFDSYLGSSISVVNGNLRLSPIGTGAITNNAYIKEWFGTLSTDGGKYVDALTDTYNVCNLIQQNNNGFENIEQVELNEKFTFSKPEIKGSRNKIFNPKLHSSNYKDVKLVWCGQDFSFDLQKLNTANFNIQYNETLAPGITRMFASIKNGMYNDTEKSYIGLTGSADHSLIYSITALESFLAQNKNFYLQRGINAAIGFSQPLNSMLTNNPAGFVGGAVNQLNSVLQSDLTIDNIKNSPSNIQNTNGDAILNYSINELKLEVEVWEGLEHELSIVDDLMFQNGFTYNRTANIKDFDNVRNGFNFVQAQIDVISGLSISNNARSDIKRRFANGVRFWNSDNIQYNLENYERWLAN